ncbi:hypothetical protein [Streptomyces rubiginosohelvolus]|uniref:hypothetical protein n=1 Tax=Streptomyces rubiginosohelvolus TaxID=67362 RepID=UPI003710CEB5
MWTGLAVAVLAGVLSFLSWDRAGQVAGVVSAVVGVAALGVGVYGDASAQGGVAFSNTGVINARWPFPRDEPRCRAIRFRSKRMAAADFRGREPELSELASFSTQTRSDDAPGKNY